MDMHNFQVLTTPMPIQPKSFLTPIRVVPIANFKSEPSLLHQVQGLPKFCIMADTSNIQQTQILQSPQILQPPPLVRLQPIQPNNNNNPQIIISNVRSEVKPQQQICIQSSMESPSKRKMKVKIKRLHNRQLLKSRRYKSLLLYFPNFSLSLK